MDTALAPFIIEVLQSSQQLIHEAVDTRYGTAVLKYRSVWCSGLVACLVVPAHTL